MFLYTENAKRVINAKYAKHANGTKDANDENNEGPSLSWMASNPIDTVALIAVAVAFAVFVSDTVAPFLP